jgi:hypothetical protein
MAVGTAYVSAVEFSALFRFEYLRVIFQFLPTMALKTTLPELTLPIIIELGLIFGFPVGAFNRLVVI